MDILYVNSTTEIILMGDTNYTSSIKEFKQFLERNPQVSSKVIKKLI
ncbi:hypothetical protein MNB_SM-4-647 [hydrothermal vent metagenome]|uniref:Uncharacterized protein n=1 Tax=hydrothermal vent metagenome TaxID=652676 RepID=A0A1W1CH04_9ZZZZ